MESRFKLSFALLCFAWFVFCGVYGLLFPERALKTAYRQNLRWDLQRNSSLEWRPSRLYIFLLRLSCVVAIVVFSYLIYAFYHDCGVACNRCLPRRPLSLLSDGRPNRRCNPVDVDHSRFADHTRQRNDLHRPAIGALLALKILRD